MMERSNTDLYQDVAEAHVLAMDAPGAGNQRLLLAADVVDSQRIADILRANVPDAVERVPQGKPGTSTLPADNFAVDHSKAERVLGLKWRSAEETFADSGRQLLEFEKENDTVY
jgi:nucleoside-diphosphate-sugar epimerase